MKDEAKDMRLTKTILTRSMKIRLIMTLMSIKRKASLMYKFIKINEQNLKS